MAVLWKALRVAGHFSQPIYHRRHKRRVTITLKNLAFMSKNAKFLISSIPYPPLVIPKLITPAEFEALVDALEGRVRLIIRHLEGTGLRISELTRLKKSDLDLDDRLIRLQAHKTKTRKYRDVVIPAPLVP